MNTLTTILISTGLCSAVIGLLFRRLEKKMDKKEKARAQHEILMLKSVKASLALGEATAEAVSRIPDAHCNGDMHDALKYARKIKHEQTDFLQEQAVEAVI